MPVRLFDRPECPNHPGAGKARKNVRILADVTGIVARDEAVGENARVRDDAQNHDYGA
jgi:hypothetical protein